MNFCERGNSQPPLTSLQTFEDSLHTQGRLTLSIAFLLVLEVLHCGVFTCKL